MSGASYSNSQVQELAIRLEKENGICRHSGNCLCSAPRDKLDQLSCKCFEECYCCMPIKQDKYVVTKLDCEMGLDKLLIRIK